MAKAARTRRHAGVAPLASTASVAATAAKKAASSAQQGSSKKRLPPTAFQARVYELTKRIPAGKISTYGALAKALNSAPRAVGQALRCNPYAPVVPCHRVITASLELGGFSGSWGVGCADVQRKRRMLKDEGVEFDDAGHLTTTGCVMSAEELGTC